MSLYCILLPNRCDFIFVCIYGIELGEIFLTRFPQFFSNSMYKELENSIYLSTKDNIYVSWLLKWDVWVL